MTIGFISPDDAAAYAQGLALQHGRIFFIAEEHTDANLPPEYVVFHQSPTPEDVIIGQAWPDGRVDFNKPVSWGLPSVV